MVKTNMTILEIRQMLDKGEVSSLDLVNFYLKEINKKNPNINAYLYVNQEGALEEAKILDEERKNGKIRGKLHGIPVALKDNMSVKGMQNTCASKFLEGYIAPYDATIVKKLKEAGAIILGKLNMDEFAMGSTNEFSAYGPVLNPWDNSRTPGGSSGGSAAAVSSLMAPISLGTDTGGSVRQPAAFNNLVGIKPTYGRISRYGITAFGSTLDQVGILSRDVKDSALMLEVLSGVDFHDTTSLDIKVPEYEKEITGDIKGLKLGVPKSFLEGLNEDIKKNLENTIEEYKKLGATVDYIDLKLAHNSLAIYYIVASAEASSNLARFDGIRYGKRAQSYENLVDLYSKSRSMGFGEEVKRRIMVGTYVLSSGYYDAFYETALKVRTLIIEEFKNVFKQYDAILCPSTPTLPSKLGEKPENVVETYLNDLYTVPANIAGIPAISVPSGFIDGLPISFQLMGDYFNEGKIYNLAYAFEREHEFTKMTPREEE